jgi:hypothetical protein
MPSPQGIHNPNRFSLLATHSACKYFYFPKFTTKKDDSMSVTSSVTGNRFARALGVVVLLFAMLVAPLNQAQAQTITPVHTKLTPDTATGGFGLYDVAPDASSCECIMAALGDATIQTCIASRLAGGESVKLTVCRYSKMKCYTFNFGITPNSTHVVYSIQNYR